MANPVWQIANNSANAASTSYTGTCPTGTVTDDLMVAFIWARSNTTISATPTLPWTFIRGPDQQGTTTAAWLYYRVATASDVAGTTTYTWTGGASVVNNVVISRITGADTTTPIQDNSGLVDAASGLTHTSSTVSPTSAEALLMYCFAATTPTTGSVTSPLIERWDAGAGAGGSTRYVYGATEPLSASGSTGTRSMTTTNSCVGPNELVAIAPPAAAAAVIPDVYYAPQPITLY